MEDNGTNRAGLNSAVESVAPCHHVQPNGQHLLELVHDTSADPLQRADAWRRLVLQRRVLVPSLDVTNGRAEAEIHSRIDIARASGTWANRERIIREAYATAGILFLERPELTGNAFLNAARQYVIADFDAHDNAHNRRDSIDRIISTSSRKRIDIDDIQFEPISTGRGNCNDNEDARPWYHSTETIYRMLSGVRDKVTPAVWKAVENRLRDLESSRKKDEIVPLF